MASNGDFPKAVAKDYTQWWSYNKAKQDIQQDK
jgi:hypothetical protein